MRCFVLITCYMMSHGRSIFYDVCIWNINTLPLVLMLFFKAYYDDCMSH